MAKIENNEQSDLSKQSILQQEVVLSPLEKVLINRLQGDLPLEENPFALVAEEIGYSEAQVIESLNELLERGVLTRFGPLFDISRGTGFFPSAHLRFLKRGSKK